MVVLGAVAWGGVLLFGLLFAAYCDDYRCAGLDSYRRLTLLIELAGMLALGTAVARRPRGVLTAGAIWRFLLSLIPAAVLFSWWLSRYLELVREG